MANQIFMQFAGPVVKGSAAVKGFEGALPVQTYSHSWEQPTNPLAPEKSAPELAHHGTFNMSMELDESFTPLLGLLWGGKHIEKGTLTCYRSAGDTGSKETVALSVPYLKVEFEAIVITHMDIADGTGAKPIANLSLRYAKVTYTYTPFDQSKGTLGPAIPKSHDLRTNVVA